MPGIFVVSAIKYAIDVKIRTSPIQKIAERRRPIASVLGCVADGQATSLS